MLCLRVGGFGENINIKIITSNRQRIPEGFNCSHIYLTFINKLVKCNTSRNAFKISNL